MKECNNYRTIALISHTSKILLIVILNKLRQKVEEELSDSDCQAGYRTNRGTVDMLFTLQPGLPDRRSWCPLTDREGPQKKYCCMQTGF